MGNVFRVINCDGDIEISIYKKANAIFKTNEYSETEDVCIHKETINIFNLLKENQELKQKYLNAVADYETTRAEKEQLNSLVNSCQEEIRRLKKQVEEYKEQVNKGLYNTCLPYTTGYNKAIKDKETQQKEFINYLEDEIQNKRKKSTTLTAFIRNVVPLQQCLQKYKEIIGDINDKK